MQTGTNFSESFTTIYEDERSFLEKTVDDYPVSALSLFLLLQNYKKTGDERYDQLIQKAALYFPNHTWLNYQLSEDDSMKYIQVDENKEESEIQTNKEEEEETSFVESELYPENNTQHPEETSTDSNLEEEAIHEMEQEEMVEFVRGEEAENFEESFVENESNPAVETITETLLEVNPVLEDKEEEILVPENMIQDDLGKDNIPDEVQIERSEEPEVALKQEETNASNRSEAMETDPVTDQELVGSFSPNPKKELEDTEENHPLEFEPLHTIDYFASQGIIIREEALMNDKLGMQMKSFTDWLKSMKKIHPGKLPEQNEVVEKIIQSSAELSNEDAGILTEAMADVLIKQGKRLKAIEMFEKLSLMNPSKSIYFAAKIESLKK